MSQDLTWDSLTKQLKSYEELNSLLRQKIRLLEDQSNANNYELLHLNAWVEKLETWIKSDSVYTLLRYGCKSATIIDGMDDCYVDLYNTSETLREKDRAELENRNDDFEQKQP
jgi:hypothetical protein